jgi:hypothetical protein
MKKEQPASQERRKKDRRQGRGPYAGTERRKKDRRQREKPR